jgi:hypothetical protein
MAGASIVLYRAPSWGVRAHADFVYLGHIGAECMCTGADADYIVATRSVKAQSLRISSNAEFSGSGNAMGVQLTLEPYIDYRGWRFGIEGGLFPYRPNWTDTAFNADKVVVYQSSHHIQLGKVAAVNISRGNFGVSFRHYWLPGPYTDASAPPLATGANVVMVTYSF